MPLLLFAGVYLFSGLSPVATSGDSRWSVYIAMGLWNHHSTTLDDYPRAIRDNDEYALECVGPSGRVTTHVPSCAGHWYDSYPIGASVVPAPLVIAAVGVMEALRPLMSHLHTTKPVIAAFLRGDYQTAHPIVEEEVASALLAAAAVVMYFIALRFLPAARAVILALLFALATSAYSVAGRALWQHTPSMLLLAIIIYMLLRSEDRPALAAWAGLPVALAYTVRPTDALFVLIFTAYVALRHRRYLWLYLLAAAPVATAFIAYNESVYHAIFSPYYRTTLNGFDPRNWPLLGAALAGNLISPGRGLFIYTPIFLLAVWSMLRRKWKTPLAPWLAALALLHWLAISAYVDNWWAGECYGPRFFTDLTPIFALFLIPYFAKWTTLSFPFRTAFVALALIAFAMHLRGGWSAAVYNWNVDPVKIDQHPARNWDWSDPPFLRP